MGRLLNRNDALPILGRMKYVEYVDLLAVDSIDGDVSVPRCLATYEDVPKFWTSFDHSTSQTILSEGVDMSFKKLEIPCCARSALALFVPIPNGIEFLESIG